VPNNERIILALNCGSSSLKYGAYRVTGKDAQLVCEGEAEEIKDYKLAFEEAWNFSHRKDQGFLVRRPPCGAWRAKPA